MVTSSSAAAPGRQNATSRPSGDRLTCTPPSPRRAMTRLVPAATSTVRTWPPSATTSGPFSAAGGRRLAPSSRIAAANATMRARQTSHNAAVDRVGDDRTAGARAPRTSRRNRPSGLASSMRASRARDRSIADVEVTNAGSGVDATSSRRTSASIRSSVIARLRSIRSTEPIARPVKERLRRPDTLAQQACCLGHGQIVEHDEGQHGPMCCRERTEGFRDGRSVIELGARGSREPMRISRSSSRVRRRSSRSRTRK